MSARLCGDNGWSSISTLPAAALNTPAMIDSVVVFPAPFGPSSPVT